MLAISNAQIEYKQDLKVFGIILHQVSIVKAECVHDLVTLVGSSASIIPTLAMVIHLVVVEAAVVATSVDPFIIALVIASVATRLTPIVVVHILMVMLLVVMTPMMLVVTFAFKVLLHIILLILVKVARKVHV